MRERVYRPGRGPWQHIGVEFEVSQAARTAKLSFILPGNYRVLLG